MRSIALTCLLVCAGLAPAQTFERLVALEQKVEKMEARLAALEGKKEVNALAQSCPPGYTCANGQCKPNHSYASGVSNSFAGDSSAASAAYSAAPGAHVYASGIPRQVRGADGCGFTVYRTPVRRVLFGR